MQCARTRSSRSDYYEPDKRYIGNAMQVFFKDGSATERVQVDYPDRPSQAPRRRHAGAGEAIRAAVDAHFPPKQSEASSAVRRPRKLDALPVNEFMAAFVTNS